MTRRYTGAEARELAERATQGEWAIDDGFADDMLAIFRKGPPYSGAIALLPNANRAANAALCAAAPDLAASLAAVEAERDALREYYEANEAERPLAAESRRMTGREIDAFGRDIPAAKYEETRAAASNAYQAWQPARARLEAARAALAALREAAK